MSPQITQPDPLVQAAAFAQTVRDRLANFPDAQLAPSPQEAFMTLVRMHSEALAAIDMLAEAVQGMAMQLHVERTAQRLAFAAAAGEQG